MRSALAFGSAIIACLVAIAIVVAPVSVARSSVGSFLDLPNDLPSPPYSDPDPFNCTDRASIPQLDNVTSVAWAPDSSVLAFVHTVNTPSRKTVTGYEEDLRVSALNVATGAVRDLGHGKLPSWSATGALLAYWDDDGSIHVLLSGHIVAEIDSSQPGFGWDGDALLYWKGNEIRKWDSGAKWTLASIDPDLAPRYPYDDVYFSADGREFTITRYSYDGTSQRYVGVTATGAVVPLDQPNVTFLEWSPKGSTLLARSADTLTLRDVDGNTKSATLASFRGAVHGWTADGRLFVGAMAATVPAGNTFDRFAVWSADTSDVVTIPNLLGSRTFSPDGKWFAGVSRTGLYTSQLELYRCGVVGGATFDLRSDPIARSRAQKIAGDGNRFVRPVAGAFTQFLQGNHTGVDIAAPYGSILVAADDGVVSAVGWVPVGGFRVCVMHAAGLESCDYHAALSLVHLGDRVARGQPVALVGMTGLTTGPHVHWEATRNGRIVNPLDQ